MALFAVVIYFVLTVANKIYERYLCSCVVSHYLSVIAKSSRIQFYFKDLLAGDFFLDSCISDAGSILLGQFIRVPFPQIGW